MNRVIGRVANGILKRFGLRLVPSKNPPSPRGATRAAPGPEAEAYLAHDNPRLADLRESYARHPIWRHVDWHSRQIGSAVDLRGFRGSDLYQTQHNRPDVPVELPYALSYYYARSIDTLGLLETFAEDGMFGCYTLEIEKNRLISRDLIDSAVELNFIFENTALDPGDPITIFDIGAGWGRLPHRTATAFPHFNVYAFDAVAESTFLCEFYLRYRGLEKNVRVVELGDAADVFGSVTADLAVNIHSFSETTYDAVKWWLGLIAKATPRYLLIVPNGYFGREKLETKDNIDYSQDLAEMGYRLVSRSPLYKSDVLVNYGVGNGAFYLFEASA